MITGKQHRKVSLLRCVFGHRIDDAVRRFRKSKAKQLTRFFQRGRTRLVASAGAAIAVGLLCQGTAMAEQPSGADVVAGSAVISVSPNVMDVNAASTRTIINWEQFSISAGNTTNFNLPDANSAVLNRVTSANMPSVINGTLNSNGHVHLVNPSGIMVGATGIVNTNAFVATTFDIANNDFLKGGALTFTDNGSLASVVNNGLINTGAGGAHLMANQIANHGSITSNGGNITMSGGGQVTLTNGVTYVQPTMETLVSGISPTAGLIQNAGTIRATGAATGGGEVYLVNPNGIILHDGTIAANVPQAASLSDPANDGDRLAAYPTNDGDRLAAYPANDGDRLAAYPTVGGHVQLEADEITLTENSVIDATGTHGGGTVLVGGDWQGSGEMTQATTVTMDAGATIDASATEQGDGGKIVLWSDVHQLDSVTKVFGTLIARAGELWGDGGQIETSGHAVEMTGISVDAGAKNGDGGLWLIDPYNYVIDSPQVEFILESLNSGTSVTVTTTADVAELGSAGGAGDAGDIALVSDLVTGPMESKATLTLDAARHIDLETKIDATQNGNGEKLSLILKAGGDIYQRDGAAVRTNGGDVIYWADTDGSNDGKIDTAASTSIVTNGGHVWMGGGEKSTNWNGMTVGDSAAVGTNGVHIRGSINTKDATNGDGAIFIHGRATDTLNARGVHLGNSSITLDAGSIQLVSDDDIRFQNQVTLKTSGGDVTIASDADNSGTGAIMHQSGTLTVHSNGGDITFGGGDNNASGFASGHEFGDGVMSGLDFQTFRLFSSGGDISLRGQSGTTSDTGDAAYGLSLNAGTTLSSGDGKILIHGIGRNTSDGGFSQGVTFGGADARTYSSFNISSSNTTADAIKIIGDASASTADTRNGYGLSFMSNNVYLVASGAGGGISLEGHRSEDFEEAVYIPYGAFIVADSGPINITAYGDDNGASPSAYLSNAIIGASSTFGVTESTSDITITADDVLTQYGSTIDTTGHFTWQPTGNTFSSVGSGLDWNGTEASGNFTGGGDVPWLKINDFNSLGGITLGKEGMTTRVAIHSELQVAGPVNLLGNRISLEANIDTTAGGTSGDVLFKATDRITIGSGFDITTAGGDVTFWADSDNNASGYIQLTANSTIDTRTAADRAAGTHTSGGGDIVMAGGLDSDADDRPDGFASSNATHGIKLGSSGSDTMTLYSGGGDIFLKGEMTAELSSGAYHGVDAASILVVDSGTGSITIEGETADAYGVTFAQGVSSGIGLDLKSAATSGTAISITGSNTNDLNHGIVFNNNSEKMVQATGGGDLEITGTGGTGRYGVWLQQTDILASSGDITIGGGTGGIRHTGDSFGSIIGSKAGTDVTSSSSDVILSGDRVIYSKNSVVDTNGTLTIQPNSTSFTAPLTWPGPRVSLASTIGGLTLGKDGNTTTITIDSSQTVDGFINVYAGDIVVNADLNTTGGGSAGDVLLKATDRITIADGTDITTGGGDVVLWSDSDNVDHGRIDLMGTSTIDTRTAADRAAGTHTSGGGEIVMAGGLDVDADGRPDGFSPTDIGHGVRLGSSSADTTTLYSGGGDILVKGQMNSIRSGANYGVGAFGMLVGNSGTGKIAIEGESTDSEGVILGAATYDGDVLDLKSAATSGTAVSIIGTTTASSVWGVDMGRPTGKLIQATGGGDVDIIGSATSYSYGAKVADSDILASTGSIEIAGGKGGVRMGDSYLGAKAGTDITSSTSDITLTGDQLVLDGDSYISTGGMLTVQPSSSSFLFDMDWPASSLNIVGALGGFTHGKIGNYKSLTLEEDLTINGDINLYARDIELEGHVVSTGNHTVHIHSLGDVIADSSTYIKSDKLLITGNTTFSLDHYNNDVNTLAFDGKEIHFVNKDNLTINTIGSTIGIDASSTINIATKAGNLTIAADVVTTNTSASAIAINAAKDTSRYTSSGGDIIIVGSPTISTGAGGRATLYTGTIAGSTGLTDLVGSGSGRFRYRGDEGGGVYSAALGSGLYGIYREQPTVTYTVNNGTATYGDSLTHSGSISGEQNGDTLSHIYASGPSFSVGGSTSTSGAPTVGDHTVTASGSNQLGYAVTYATGTLTVNQKALTVSGFDAANKTYDGNLTASIANAGSLTGVISGDTVGFSNSGATFDDKNVGTDKTVTLSGISLTGTDAANYSIGSTTTNTANITQKTLTLNGFDAGNKTYDGNTTASIADAGSLAGVVFGDTVSVSNSGATFADKNVADGKTVTLNGISISGTDSSNYSIGSTVTDTANISQKAITLSGFDAGNKTYDGNTTASIANAGSLVGVVSGDTVSVSNSGATFADKNVADGKTVTLNGVSISGTDSGNYSIGSTVTDTANISQKTIALSGFDAGNKTYDGNTTATISNAGSLVGVVSGDTVSVSNSGATFSDKNAADGKTVTLNGVSISGTDSGNYSIGSTVTDTANISQKAITLSGFDAGNKIYDGNTTASIANTGSLTGVVSGDTVSVSNSGATFADKNVADGKTVTLNGISISGTDSGNYSIGSMVTDTANISQKAITLSGFDAGNKTYDGNTIASITNAGSLVGVVSGDTVSVSNSGATFADKNVADGKTVTLNGVSISGTDSGNYSIGSTVTDTANISQKTIALSGFDAGNKTYDGNTTASIANAGSLVGVVSGDTVSVSNSGATFSDKNVADGKTVTLNGVSISGTDSGNYSIGSTVTDTANISQKAITLSGFDAGNKTYDGNTTASITNAGSLVGVVSGDTVSVSNSGATFADKNVADGKTVTLNGISISGTDSGNYSIGSMVTDTANISQKTITLSGFDAGNKTYDGNTTASIANAGSLVGVVSGDTVSVSNSGATFADKNVATGKTVTLNGISISGTDSGNYSIGSTVTDTANISQKAITLSGFDADNKTYDGNTTASIANAGSLVGVVSGDTVSVSNSGATFADKNAADGKTVTLNGISISGTDSGNYSIGSTVADTANISKLAITLDGFDAGNKVYDGNTIASITNAGSLVGVVSGDTVSVSNSGATFADKNVADGKTVTLNGISISGTDSGNYSIGSMVTDTANISQKAITLSGFDAGNKTYDGNTTASIANAGSLVGVVSGDTVSVSNSGATFADKNVATGKTVTLNGISISGTDSGNYSIGSTVTDTANISQKAITLSGFDADNKTYDGNTTASIANAGSLVGVVSGDTVSVSNSGATFADKNAADGKTVTLNGISISGTDSGNYSIGSTVADTANISKLAITLDGFDAGNKVYDGNTIASITNAGSLVGVVSGDTVSVSNSGATFADKNVADGKTVTLNGISISGTDSGNYSIGSTVTDTANISQKAITLSGLAANNRAYDGTTSATVDLNGVIFGGMIVGDNLTASDTIGVFDNKSVGTGKSVTLSGTTYGGTDVGNYQFTDQTAATANITQKAVTISGLSVNNRIYDGTTAATVGHSGVTFDGMIAGDNLTASDTTGVFDNKNVGIGKSVTLSGTTYGGTDVGNYQFTDQTASTADITQKAVTISGLSTNNRVYDGTTTATVDHSGVTFGGMIAGDSLTASGTTGVFGNKSAGTEKSVTLSGTTYGGTDVRNYQFTDQTAAAADITQKAVTIAGLAANNRVYNGTTSATVDHSGVTFGGIIAGDNLTASGTTGVFNDKNVGTEKSVTLSGTTYGGTDVGNYQFTDQTAATANITQKAVTISSVSANNRIYNGTTTATVDHSGVTFGGMIAGDNLTASGTTGVFDDKNAGTGKSVALSGTTYGGIDVGNYQFTDQTASTANITRKAVTIGGLSANNRVYDATTAATVDYSGVTFGGLVAGDSLSIDSLAGNFSDKNVSDGKTVNLTTTYRGSDLGNYSITDQASTTANITPKALAVSGITASNKVYDGSTVVTVDGSDVNFGGLISGDSLSIDTLSGLFSDENVASDKTVGLSTTYTGSDFGNYAITDQATTTANITAKSITISGLTAANKVYDGTTSVVIDHSGATFNGMISGDQLSASSSTGTLNSKNVGTGKTATLSGTTYGGTDAGNYSYVDQSTTTSDVTAKSITVSGLVVDSRDYDGSTVATINHSGVNFGGMIDGDDLSVSATGLFADKNVDTGKLVTISSTYGGMDRGNYSIASQTSTLADIMRLSSVTWVGGATGDWSDPANWTGGAIPDLANVADVIIPLGITPTFDDNVAGPVDIDSLSGGNLQIDSGILSVLNDVDLNNYTQNGGTLNVDGDLNVSNSFAQSPNGATGVKGDVDINHQTGDLIIRNLSGKNIAANSTTGSVHLGDVAISGTPGTLHVTAGNGDIGQLPGTRLDANGEATFAATGDVTLGNAGNEFGDSVNASGNDVVITDGHGGLSLGTITTVGNFTSTSTDGPIDQSAGDTLNIGGTTTVAATMGGNPADVTLGNSGNDFQGTVSVDGHNVVVVDGTGGLKIDTLNAAGDATLISSDGEITQTIGGSVTVGGESTLEAHKDGESAAIDMQNPTNSFGGTVNVKASSLKIKDASGSITFGDIQSDEFDGTLEETTASLIRDTNPRPTNKRFRRLQNIVERFGLTWLQAALKRVTGEPEVQGITSPQIEVNSGEVYIRATKVSDTTAKPKQETQTN